MCYMADAMKQDCGQNQFTRGEGGLNVTAGTAIHYLQEAGGKITRWHTERFKDAFRRMVEQILWVLSEYMEPGRKLRIVGGWNSSGGMRERIIELIAPSKNGGALPRPAYTVRVQVQKNNPSQIQADNEFLMQAVKICADRGETAAAGERHSADGGISDEGQRTAGGERERKERRRWKRERLRTK